MTESALIVVDVQNDFCPGGALAVPCGDQVIEPLNIIINYARANRWLVIASRDWHPANHCSFKEWGGPWPPHCVQAKPGANFHPNIWYLLLISDAIVISKGTEKTKDSYSAFGGGNRSLISYKIPSLEEILRKNNVDVVYIGGLATDYCVKATALDAVRKEFKTYLLLDACRAVNINPGDSDRAVEEMRQAGVIITSTEKVLND